MNPVESYNQYWELSTKIWRFNDIQSQLKEWWEILLAVKEKYWKEHDLYKKFEKEYKDLYEAIKTAIESQKTFSQEERAKIVMELGDVVKLAQNNWIIEKKNWYSDLWDVLKNTNTEQAKKEALSFRDKNVKNYTKAEAISAMEYLSSKYVEYKDVWNDDKLSKWLTFQYSTINQLDDRYEVRLFQDELIKKIFWDKKQFNEQFVLWFNHEKWNFLVKIDDFEKDLKESNIKDINSKALSNYFLYLEAKWELTTKKLIEVFWENNLLDLEKLWLNKSDKSDDKKDIAKKALESKWILKTILGLINVFSSSDKLIKMLLDNTKNPSLSWKEQEEIAMLFIQKNIKWIQEKIKSDIKTKYLKNHPGKEKEAQEIADKLISELETCKTKDDVQKALKIFYNYSEKYWLELDYKPQLENLFKLREAQNAKWMMEKEQTIRITESDLKIAIQNWDTKKQLELETQLEELKKQKKQTQLQATDLEIAKKLVQDLSPEDEKKLIQWWEKEFGEFQENVRKQNKDIDALYKKYEAKKEEFFEKYPEEKEKLTTNQNQNQEVISQTDFSTISYSDGTDLNYEEVSSWSISIFTSEWKINITSKEFWVIKDNKEALDNLINFRNTLNELWLSQLWNYREKIFKSLKNVYGFVSFNEEGDFIDENELNRFLKAILNSIWIESDSNNIETTKLQFINENNISVIWWAQKVWVLDRTNIEKKFFETFIKRDNKEFRFDLFEKTLSK